MTVPEILRAAAGEVRKGWCRNFFAYEGRVCALGGIGAVLSGSRGIDAWFGVPAARCGSLHAAVVALAEVVAPGVVEATGVDRQNAVAAWNNASDQTAENVALAMEFAAVLYEQHSQTQGPPGDDVSGPLTEVARCL